MTKHKSPSDTEPKIWLKAFGAEKSPTQELRTDLEQTYDQMLMISKDKDGIPVIYDAFTHEKGLDKPDDFSILSH